MSGRAGRRLTRERTERKIPTSEAARSTPLRVGPAVAAIATDARIDLHFLAAVRALLAGRLVSFVQVPTKGPTSKANSHGRAYNRQQIAGPGLDFHSQQQSPRLLQPKITTAQSMRLAPRVKALSPSGRTNANQTASAIPRSQPRHLDRNVLRVQPAHQRHSQPRPRQRSQEPDCASHERTLRRQARGAGLGARASVMGEGAPMGNSRATLPGNRRLWRVRIGRGFRALELIRRRVLARRDAQRLPPR